MQAIGHCLVTLTGDEHAPFTAINRASWSTYSPLAFLVGFPGVGPFYLTFVRGPVTSEG